VHKATVEKFGAKWTRPENMVSNGAFKLAKWEMNKVITLVPNPHYWDRQSVKLEEANFYPVDNLDTEEKMFRSNTLQVTNEVPLEKLPALERR
jgi:oligopeptide transport system substrate-binding protein